MNNTIRITALCALISTQGHAAVSNPASINYVNQAVAAGVAQTTYTAGTAISILNNVISGAYQAGSGITITDNEIASTAPIYAIGDQAQGGVVFYVEDGGRHGLVIALEDQSSGIQFSSVNQYAHTNGVGGGVINTAQILAVQLAVAGGGGTAASEAANYSTVSSGVTGECPLPNAPVDTSYTRSSGCVAWYLGSVAEYALVNAQFTTVNNGIEAADGIAIQNASYWTSNVPQPSANNDQGFMYNMSTANLQNDLNTNLHPVRAISRF